MRPVTLREKCRRAGLACLPCLLLCLAALVGPTAQRAARPPAPPPPRPCTGAPPTGHVYVVSQPEGKYDDLDDAITFLVGRFGDKLGDKRLNIMKDPVEKFRDLQVRCVGNRNFDILALREDGPDNEIWYHVYIECAMPGVDKNGANALKSVKCRDSKAKCRHYDDKVGIWKNLILAVQAHESECHEQGKCERRNP